MNKEKRIIIKRIRDSAGSVGFVSQLTAVSPSCQAG